VREGEENLVGFAATGRKSGGMARIGERRRCPKLASGNSEFACKLFGYPFGDTVGGLDWNIIAKKGDSEPSLVEML
jgi:hypothetical protein